MCLEVPAFCAAALPDRLTSKATQEPSCWVTSEAARDSNVLMVVFHAVLRDKLSCRKHKKRQRPRRDFALLPKMRGTAALSMMMVSVGFLEVFVLGYFRGHGDSEKWSRSGYKSTNAPGGREALEHLFQCFVASEGGIPPASRCTREVPGMCRQKSLGLGCLLCSTSVLRAPWMTEVAQLYLGSMTSLLLGRPGQLPAPRCGCQALGCR